MSKHREDMYIPENHPNTRNLMKRAHALADGGVTVVVHDHWSGRKCVETCRTLKGEVDG